MLEFLELLEGDGISSVKKIKPHAAIEILSVLSIVSKQSFSVRLIIYYFIC